MENIERKELAKYLKRGDRNKIAEAAGVERKAVTRWLDGEIKNSIVEPFIIQWVEKRKKEVKNRINKKFISL